MTLPWRYLRIGALVWLAACASTAGSGTTTGGGNRAVLSVEELRAEPGRSLEEVIRRRRPQWLAGRGATSLDGGGSVVVYQDGVRTGGPEVLRTIRTDVVESVRFLTGPEATTSLGTGHPQGAILVVLRRR